ncbi:hypothetical protein LCGC14_2836070, partial [marine sediment metagenome]
AAFKDPATGKVYPTGQMHDMEVMMREFGFDPDNENDWEEFTKIYNTLINGFITDEGRFFDRQEAAKLVGSPEERLSTELVKGMGPNSYWQRRGTNPEIKEDLRTLDTSVYGSWILPDGKIIAVEDHITFLLNYYDYQGDDVHNVEPENQDKLMDRALDDGLVRIVTSNYPNYIELHSRKEILKKTFKLWWKSAIAADNVFLDIDATYTTIHRYKMPADKQKLKQDFGYKS